jgi:DNA-binding transcriptional ArsR family regulator
MTLKQEARKAGRRPITERTRLPEDAPPFAVGHYLRLEALTILHEGEFTAGEVAHMLGEDVKNVHHHLSALYEAGCVELAGHRVEGNFRKPVYRAIARPFISDEEYDAMSVAERHDANSAIVQWILAECLSSYRNEKMDRDKDVCLIADEPDLDTKGREEVREFLTTAWSGEPDDVLAALKSIQEITCRAANRMAESGETGTTMFVTLLAFERGRSGRPTGGAFNSGKTER